MIELGWKGNSNYEFGLAQLYITYLARRCWAFWTHMDGELDRGFVYEYARHEPIPIFKMPYNGRMHRLRECRVTAACIAVHSVHHRHQNFVFAQACWNDTLGGPSLAGTRHTSH